MNTTFACTCGATEWQVTHLERGTHAACYCADCQTFARHLGADILDEAGGTDLLQVAPCQVTFTKGVENLALLRLSPKGLCRWYTSCCNTPVANTLASGKWPFASLMTAAHRGDPALLGPVVARLNTVYAKGPGKPAKDNGLFRLMREFIVRSLGEWMSGRWKQTPFFAPPDWAPVVEPRVLSPQQRNRARP